MVGTSKYKMGDKRISTTDLEYTLVDEIRSPSGKLLFEVEFTKTGYRTKVQVKEFVNGSIKDLLNPSICGVGHIGVGQYKSSGENEICYQTWRDMLKRCYSPKTPNDAKIYHNVTVTPTWHDYQVFGKWFYNNHVAGYRLDKDLTIIGNKQYSPTACCFVPVAVNSFLAGGLRRGIYFCNRKRKWVVDCCIGELRPNGKYRSTFIGAYNSEMEALTEYKKVKMGLCDNLECKYPDLPSLIFDNIRVLIAEIK